MTAILWDQNLEEYINAESKKPEPANKDAPTAEDAARIGYQEMRKLERG